MVQQITVKEDWLARAILRLVEQEKYVVEGGGAVGVAAIMAGFVPELAAKKSVHFVKQYRKLGTITLGSSSSSL